MVAGGQTWIGEIEDAIEQVLNARTVAYRGPEGVRSLAVAPDGGLYVDVPFIGLSAFRFGSVHEGIDPVARREWAQKTHVGSMDACRGCWARHYCGGGSRAVCYARTGDARNPHPDSCRLIRRTYELAMGVCLELAETDPDRLRIRYGREDAA